MFTGDSSGDWLFKALYETVFANQANSNNVNDGLQLYNCFIASIIHCAPPKNKPTTTQIDSCSVHLVDYINQLSNLKVVLTLGGIAFKNYCKLYDIKIFKVKMNSNEPKVRSIHHKHEYNDHFFALRNYPETAPDLNAYENQLNKIKERKTLKAAKRNEADWRLEGPTNIGGRINTVAVHPNNTNIMLAGAAKGGIFKTTNDGLTWNPVFDDFLQLSISKIVYDPNNSDIIYAGTGDANISGYPSVGDGIYKSIDGGDTWKRIGLTFKHVIADIYIAPQNSNIIYVASMGVPYERDRNRGLYKSTNGGTTWRQVLFVSESAGIIDMDVDPNNPNTIYAAAWNRIRNNTESLTKGTDAKIYKSVNGGGSWEQLTNGLPFGKFSRIGLAMSNQNSKKLYATYVDSLHRYHNTYKTIDGGETWTELEYNSEQINAYGGPGQDFGWYFGKIRVAPDNDDILYLLGVNLWEVSENGENWRNVMGNSTSVHVDNHDMQFIDSKTAIVATDGGLYKGELNSNGNWLFKDADDIAVSQFYRVSVNPHKSGLYTGGLQDNGTIEGNYLSINAWQRVWGSDGFTVQFLKNNENIRYVSVQNGNLYILKNYGTSSESSRSFNSGIDPTDRTNWDTPFLVSQHNDNIMYRGTFRMYKNENSEEANWTAISEDLTDGIILNKRYHTITTISESPLSANVLMAGTVDANVWITKDGGENWDAIYSGLPERYITSVKNSYENEAIIYVTQSGYKDNDDNPYIFKSTNYGECWRSISGNLPLVALNDIEIYDNGLDNVLFVATDGGVFYSNNGGVYWEFMNGLMPSVPVYDIQIDYENERLVAGTHARSMYSYPIEDIIANATIVSQNMDIIPPVISVSSPLEILIALGTTFTYPNVSASDDVDCDLTDKIVVSSNLDINTVGTYTINYFVSDEASNLANAEVLVTVYEDLPPELNVNSLDEINVFQGSTFVLPSYTAIDEIDGDLTINIRVEDDININVPGIYTLTFLVTDSGNNTVTKIVKVNVVEDLPPVISIEGNTTIETEIYYSTLLPNFTAFDEVDGDLTEEIIVDSSNVDNTQPGDYTIYISVTDSYNQTTTEELVVKILLVDVDEYFIEKVKIYPNPATSIIQLSNHHLINEIKIFNALGELMLQTTQTSQNFNINNWPVGEYYASLLTINNQKMTLNFIKQ